jgi:HlyD family secretion protein
MPVDQSRVEAVLKRDLQRRGRRRWIVLGVIAVIVVIGGYVWWSAASSPEGPAYRTEEASIGDIIVTVTATGTVEPTNIADITSEISGVITSVSADFNDRVEQGQVLASLDTRDLESANALAQATLSARQAEVTQAVISHDEAQSAYERLIQLHNRGVASDQQLQAAESAFNRAEAALRSARAGVEIARAEVARNEVNLARACICSPIGGMVLERNVEIGQNVTASFQAPALFRIAEDLSRMELHVDIDQADIGAVSEGDLASFTVEAYRGRDFPARVSEIRFAPQSVNGIVTYEAVLAIDNAELLLRPGMTATADIIVDEADDAVRVPNAALRFTPDMDSFFAPQAAATEERTTRILWILREGAATPVEVAPGVTDGSFTEIVDGDVAAGDAVIVGTN